MRTDEKRYWKKRIRKSTRFDKIVDSFVDWLIETGQTLDTSESSTFKKFVCKIDPS